ncbi:MAG: hypothetical protein U0Z26_00795 [Anaerolineales bacterium]
MRSSFRMKIQATALFLVLMMSAVLTIPAYAEDGIPPVDVPAETQPTEPLAQDGAVTEATPQTQPEAAPILAELPQNTNVVVVSEQGSVLPLASQDAAQAIVHGDPVWCPVGVAPGGVGCTSPTTSFNTMLTNLTSQYGATGPSKAGVIWIEDSYISNAVGFDPGGVSVLNGSSLTAMRDFALTIQGGWTGTGTNINTANPSVFNGTSLTITGWNNDVTLNDITITGNTSAVNALWVSTTGNITTTRVTVQNNTNDGAVLNNNIGSSVGNVTINDSQFNGNSGTSSGLFVSSFGTVTLKNVTASNNGTGANGFGIYMNNANAITPKAVTLTNVTTSNNHNTGLKVITKGGITASSLTANTNGVDGAQLENFLGVGNVTLSGTNTFSGNINTGLSVESKGVVNISNVQAVSNYSGVYVKNNNAATPMAVTLTNLTASSNTYGITVQSLGLITATDLTANNNSNGVSGYGASLRNDYAGATAGVTLKGTNIFFSNKYSGLEVYSKGAVSLNNIQSVNNGGYGTFIENDYATPQPVTLTGSNVFKFNVNTGLYIRSLGQITASNVTSNSNSIGADLDNQLSSISSGITLTGVNYFNSNSYYGLVIKSAGAVALNNINANDNGVVGSAHGLFVDNTFGTLFKGVTLTGTNVFNGNKDNGLYIKSEGIISLSNITANGNHGAYGAYIDNTFSGTSAPKTVTLTGFNIFKNNEYQGLTILSHGAITVNNITASVNGFSGFGFGGVILDNDSASVPANVTIAGTNLFEGNKDTGLKITTLGSILTNNITITGTTNSYGAYLINNGVGVGNVTMTGTNLLTGNKSQNLYIRTNGTVTLSNVTASGSISNYGADIVNSTATTPKAVTLTGNNSFIGNASGGLAITSKGIITISNLTANTNGSYGVVLDNRNATAPAGVTLTGFGTFNGNTNTGLHIQTFGNVTANTLTAKDNATNLNASGVYIDGSQVGAIGNVSLTGTNYFSGNRNDNLSIYAYGAVTVSNLTSIGSLIGVGAYIYNANDAIAKKPVTLVGVATFNNNNSSGLSVGSYGVITTNGLIASGNGVGSGSPAIVLANQNATTPVDIILKGTTTSTLNYGPNLQVTSKGNIVAGNVTATGSINAWGAYFNNGDYAGATGTIVLTGTNNFSNNNGGGGGVSFVSKNAITINNITASFNNHGDGVYIDNTQSGFAAPKPVTITGYLIANNNANNSKGLFISSYGSVVTNNVTAIGNNNNGVNIDLVQIGGVTPSNLTMNGANTFTGNNGDGLYVEALGTVLLNSVNATDNVFNGVSIYTNFTGATGAVILNGTNIIKGNDNAGLGIEANGTVTINSITASENGASLNPNSGIQIDNTYLGTSAPKAVKFTGTNVMNDNFGHGLKINSYGVVTLNNMTANGNTANGVWVNNSGTITAATVTITGTNQFSHNSGGMGLYIQSDGNVVTNNVTASANSDSGVNINNTTGSFASVTLNGVNTLVGNGGNGLTIETNGTVNLTKITADGNAIYGMSILANTGNINLTCASLVNNTGRGYDFSTSGIMTLKGVLSAGNGMADTATTGTVVKVYGCPLP